MGDFLTFKSFISIDILIFFYYIGAIVIPIALYKSKNYLIINFKIFDMFNKLLLKLFNLLDAKDKLSIKISLFVLFIFMEIFWRMMFEMIIAYFQMRDYLQSIAFVYN